MEGKEIDTNLPLSLAVDGDRLDADNLATTDKRVELRALLQLVPDALPSFARHPRANFVLLQPVLLVARRLDALVNDGALLSEVSAPVATVGDVATVAAAHPLCCGAGSLGSGGGNVAEGVDLEQRVPVVECCDRGSGGGERDGVCEDVGEEHGCIVVVLKWV